MKIDWKRKLTSRKLWLAVAGFVTGVVLIFTAGATEETITGTVMALGSIVSYIVGEGLTDAAAMATATSAPNSPAGEIEADRRSGEGENQENPAE